MIPRDRPKQIVEFGAIPSLEGAVEQISLAMIRAGRSVILDEIGLQGDMSGISPSVLAAKVFAAMQLAAISELRGAAACQRD